MTADYKLILGVLASLIGFIGYAPYLRDMLRRTIRPHVFSWFVWGILQIIVFFAQISRGAGPGAIATAISAVVAFFIVSSALREKDKQITVFDWIAFSGAIIGIALWILAGDPLFAVICVVFADALGFVPTFRKSFIRPQEETLFQYIVSIIKWIFAILALESVNLVTVLYPASLIITNSIFVIMTSVRRKQLAGAESCGNLEMSVRPK